jgi:hypothetical protein
VNRTTISRALPDFGGDLVTLGATRSTRYVLRREIRNSGSRWPVFRIGEDGKASEWAELEALHERSWRVNWAGARLIDAGGRRFLEVPRFDRRGAAGRLGVVSLEALSAASVGLARDWNSAAVELRRRELIGDDSLATVRRLQAFGELIGNSDMHSGNLGFFLGDSLPLRITPCYDMLPMLWAPGPQGEIVNRSFAPAPPIPWLLDPWRDAAGMAENFWRRVAEDPRISPAFRSPALEALEVVGHLRRHVG